MYPADTDPTVDQRTSAAYGIPRKIIIELQDSIKELSADHLIQQSAAEAISAFAFFFLTATEDDFAVDGLWELPKVKLCLIY